MRLAAGFQADLYYWHRYLQQWNGTQTWRVAAPIVMVSDASLQGFGFYLGVLSLLTSTALPSLLCCSLALASWASILLATLPTVVHIGLSVGVSYLLFSMLPMPLPPDARNRSVTFVVDNSTDVSIINRQSTRSPRLAVLLRALYDLSVRYNFRISAVHRAGDLNVLADFLSRITVTPPTSRHHTDSGNKENMHNNNVPHTNAASNPLPVLSRPGYYCEPPLSALKLQLHDDPSALTHIKNFTVGHETYGKIVWQGETDVTGTHWHTHSTTHTHTLSLMGIAYTMFSIYCLCISCLYD